MHGLKRGAFRRDFGFDLGFQRVRGAAVGRPQVGRGRGDLTHDRRHHTFVAGKIAVADRLQRGVARGLRQLRCEVPTFLFDFVV